MGVTTMGRVLVAAKIENLGDLYAADAGQLLPEQVRIVSVAGALVGTGMFGLSLPKALVTQLGLSPTRKRRARTAAGVTDLQMYTAVRLTVQGRDCLCDVTEIPDNCPVLLGQIPLELLDFVVDPVGQRLIGNPEHGGEQMIDMFYDGADTPDGLRVTTSDH